MGISNTIPPSRLIQPGVVANTAARPTSPFTGQAIYQVDTNQMLIWNGTAWVIPNTPAQNPTGLEFISTKTIGTTVSSVTVSSVFSATYDNYRIVISGVTGTINNDSFLMSMTGSSGSTYKSTSFYLVYNSASFNGVAFATGTSFRIGWTNNSNDMNYVLDLLNPFIAKPTFFTSNGANSTITFQNAGEDTSTSSCTGFTLTPSSGTLTGGIINIYGYRKS